MTPQPGLQALVEKWASEAQELQRKADRAYSPRLLGQVDSMLACADELANTLHAHASAEGGLAEAVSAVLDAEDFSTYEVYIGEVQGNDDALVVSAEQYEKLLRAYEVLVRNAALRGGDGFD